MARSGRYGNIKKHVAMDGTKLDSKREYTRYLDLLLLVQAKEIKTLVVHPRYQITIGGVPILMRSKRYPNGRHLTYVADFTYYMIDENGESLGKIVEDVKMQSGHRTEVYKIKRALMSAMGIHITEY